MVSLNVRMFFLVALMFAVVYAIITVFAAAMGMHNFAFYAVLAGVMMFIQYMAGPFIIERFMGVRYVTEKDEPELYAMVSEMAQKAKIPVPRLGISNQAIPNAFAFGRSLKDGRICVTSGILKLLDRHELRAVLGHELSHIRNRDVLTITLLSVIPLIMYRVAFHMMFFGGRGRRNSQNTLVLGLVAFIFYFITNLIVLYGSRVREFFADRGSVALGNHPRYLASALYKLVYGSSRLSKESTRSVQGVKAFFLNDPSRAQGELKEFKQIDHDGNGVIDIEDLRSLSRAKLRLTAGARLAELFSTHPNMLKRVKKLSGYL